MSSISLDFPMIDNFSFSFVFDPLSLSIEVESSQDRMVRCAGAVKEWTGQPLFCSLANNCPRIGRTFHQIQNNHKKNIQIAL